MKRTTAITCQGGPFNGHTLRLPLLEAVGTVTIILDTGRYTIGGAIVNGKAQAVLQWEATA